MVYVPHLDYDLQRFGPSAPQAVAVAAEVDRVLAPLLDDALNAGAAIVVVSEYGITEARHPVDINRALRAEGLLEVHTQAGMEYLDPWTSRAFAVARPSGRPRLRPRQHRSRPGREPGRRPARGGRGAGSGRAGSLRAGPPAFR